MRTTFLGAAAAAAAATLVTAVAPPATAAAIGVEDPADVRHGVDLRAVQVTNGERNLRIVLSHANLRRDHRSAAGGAVYVDTDPRDRGPELVFVGGYFEGTDYQLLRTEGFGVRNWGAPVHGSYSMSLDYDKEQTRMRISRQVLGRATSVRVAVRVSGRRADGTHVVDWLGRPRSFTPWVRRG
ncbi:MAG: hypothetical protein WB441_03740 [Nocardioidaceae bacterium]